MTLDSDSLKVFMAVAAFASIAGAAVGVVHRFVSSMRSTLDVFGVRLDSAVSKVDAVATKLEAADVSLLKHRVVEAEKAIASLDHSHHRLVNNVTAFQLRVAGGNLGGEK